MEEEKNQELSPNSDSSEVNGVESGENAISENDPVGENQSNGQENQVEQDSPDSSTENQNQLVNTQEDAQVTPNVVPETELVAEYVEPALEPASEKTQFAEENTPNYPEVDKKTVYSRINIMRAIFLVLLVAFVFWLLHKDNKIQEGGFYDIPDGIKVIVDDTRKEGIVTIIEDDGSRLIGQNMPNGNVVSTINATSAVVSGPKVINFYSKVGNDCTKVYALQRDTVKKYDSDLVNSIRQLMIPLSNTEKAQGFVSMIPAGTTLSYIKVDNGQAIIHLSQKIATAAGSCAVMAIRSQIEQTAKQFPYVKSVLICAGENCDQSKILQP